MRMWITARVSKGLDLFARVTRRGPCFVDIAVLGLGGVRFGRRGGRRGVGRGVRGPKSRTHCVVGHEAGVVIQDEPPVLPPFHHIRPLAQVSFHSGHFYQHIWERPRVTRACGRGTLLRPAPAGNTQARSAGQLPISQHCKRQTACSIAGPEWENYMAVLWAMYQHFYTAANFFSNWCLRILYFFK